MIYTFKTFLSHFLVTLIILLRSITYFYFGVCFPCCVFVVLYFLGTNPLSVVQMASILSNSVGFLNIRFFIYSTYTFQFHEVQWFPLIPEQMLSLSEILFLNIHLLGYCQYFLPALYIYKAFNYIITNSIIHIYIYIYIYEFLARTVKEKNKRKIKGCKQEKNSNYPYLQMIWYSR